ncbi:ABC transporter ATP-binding protein [Candidatus Atribacteria bacterium 1244-E10-H5-B2]|nr:MAG: ABC transporter ATP-binding protein [Candidatus Atribacteria bacterium 1244-E10-H5-B2]
MIEVTKVSSGYGKMQVLREVSLHVNKGEIVCLLGSNGAGKTTTLKTILGMVEASSGSIKLFGEDVTRMKTAEIIKKGVGIAPEGRGLFPKMTVLENLQMGAIFEKDEKIIEDRIKHAFQLFPRLEERKKQVAGTLSGGEQGMLSIGRALMSEPKFLILDEPSLGLAPILIEIVFNAIKLVSKELMTTILLSEQHAMKALNVADRGYVLEKGQIIFEGTSEELANSEVIKSAYMR